MTDLTKQEIKFTITNYTPSGPTHTNIVHPTFNLLKLDDKHWRLVSDVIQVNVNDPRHGGTGVVNIGRWVAGNCVIEVPRTHTPDRGIGFWFVEQPYTALVSNGQKVEPATKIRDNWGFSADYGGYKTMLYFAVTQEDYMGTTGIRLEVAITALAATKNEDQVSERELACGWNIADQGHRIADQLASGR